jgi:membrane-associated phospholipid phosphatase
MTPFIYAIEGDIVLWIQQTFENEILTATLTHFYVAGYMLIIFSAFVYTCYFDDRHMADRVTLTMLFTYMLAIPFYLFFNVRVTGDHIPGMETLGYQLTPEIQTWFTRIDPFTNGMPSLHIGMPFAIWLCYARNDLDGRWRNWRIFLVVYMMLTAFAILYLGIHWVSDIIGGILIAILAVKLAERAAPGTWRWLDERVFVHRISWLFADWRRPVAEGGALIGRGIAYVRVPGPRQTAVAMALLIVGTSGTLLWDATHQHFPAEGVSHPGGAAGADGWLVALDTDENGNLTAISMDLETGEQYPHPLDINIDGNQSHWNLDYAETEVLISENHALVWQGYRIIPIWFDNPTSTAFGRITGPLYEDVALVDSNEHSYRYFTLDDGTVVEESEPFTPISDADVQLIVGEGSSLAWVTQSAPLTANVIEVDGVQHTFSVTVNATIDAERDAQVESMTNTVVDYGNATIVDIALDERYMVAQVNLSAVDRLVLVDLATGEQRILGDPVFPVANPSIGHGRVAYQQKQFLISNNPNPEYMDWEVDFHIIAENRSYPLHAPDDIDQTDPQAMGDHIVWMQVDADGQTEIRIYTVEVVFEPYSSRVLQIFVLLFPLLLLTWISQRIREKETRIRALDEEE